MPHDHRALIGQLRELLTQQRYNAVAIQNYCRSADHFLNFLAQGKIAVDAATSAEVSRYLRCSARRFRQRHGYAPAAHWQSIPRAGINALLRLVQKRWPPEPPAASPGEVLCQTVCTEYREWLREERGLAVASIDALMWEARHFCAWYIERADIASFSELNIRDVDAYFEARAPGLRRKSLKDVAERLRSLLRHLHRTGRTAVDLAPQIIAPMLYAYESIPSALSLDQVAAVLKSTRKDRSPMGLRGYAILLLLSTYGMRAGEIAQLRLDDIDWRAETLRIRHSKTGARSLLPLMEPVGKALIDYLQHGRPKTDAREIFIRSRAPYRPLSRIYSEVRGRMEAAGVRPSGKRGPHIFRHARAVSLLRAAVPQKVIGDILGHRSTEATIPYLKLATEDLRAIALEIPGQEARS
ncbi:MAG TPA: site-specific integrase [Stellaceae bacterium]|nr:site-specific integrase [Stellaceae bacterium]